MQGRARQELQFKEMKSLISSWVSFSFFSLILAQANLAFSAAPAAVTVPAVIDHNRVTIAVDVPMPDGSAQPVRAWVDTGSTDLVLSRRLAVSLGLDVTCNETDCSSPPPAKISIQGLAISLTEFKQAKIPLRPVSGASLIAAGMRAEISLPATILRHFDVMIDFPGHKFSIGPPGSIQFKGSSEKAIVNQENGLVQIPSKIEDRKYNLALDVGASISLLSSELFDKVATAHGDWPRMTGAVSSANMWGAADEAKSQLMRIDRVQYGPLFLTDVPVVSTPKQTIDFFEKRAGVATVGAIGSDVLLNYRVGFDYAHSMVYFDIGRLFNFPEFDVVGLILRPEDDGRFTILGVVNTEEDQVTPHATESLMAGDSLIAVEGIPVRGSTMGQVWSMLRGQPGQERDLTIERTGKQTSVVAHVRHFLAALPDAKEGKKKK
jgi:predicted aspartyl protease